MKQTTEASPTELAKARSHLTRQLGEWLDRYEAAVIRQGHQLLDRTTQIFFQRQNRIVHTKITDHGWDYHAKVHLPSSLDEPLSVSCPCAGALGDRCAHTWALLTQIHRLLQRDPDSEFSRELLQIDVRPSWLRRLDAVDAILDSREKTHATESDQRLTWRVGVSSPLVRIGAWQQKISKTTGKWTPGRQRRPDQLLDDPWAPPQDIDERVAQALMGEHGYFNEWLSWHGDTFAALQALVGHPYVFDWDQPARRLVVEDAKVGLSIRQEGESLAAEISVAGRPLPLSLGDQGGEGGTLSPSEDQDAGIPSGPHWDPLMSFPYMNFPTPPVDPPKRTRSLPPKETPPQDEEGRHPTGCYVLDPGERGLVVLLEETDQVLVATVEPAILGFTTDLLHDPLMVPPEGRDEFLQRLVRLESLMPIDLAPDLVGETRPAEVRPHLRLEPAGPEGLEARLLVRPTPESYFSPGEGRPRILGIDDGQRVVFERALEDEEAMARRQVRKLGLDAYPESPHWHWSVESADAALDLVLAAQEQAGDDLVVEWPEGERRRVASAIAPAALRVRISDRRDWFGLRGEIEGDGYKLPLLAVLEALRQGRRYVAVGDGTWAEITHELRQRLTSLDDVAHIHRRRIEVDATAMPLLREIGESEAVIQASARYRKTLKRLENAERIDPDPPPDLSADLRGYQVEGYRWLRRLADWGVGGCLADDMGLGKTVQALAVLVDRRREGPALVAAPTSVGFNWVRETERFAPTLRAVLYRETDRDAALKELGPGDLVVTSYGLLRRDVDKLADVDWSTLVLDEAQAIKNSRTKTAQAVRRLQAEWKVALTGTPVENHLGELWSLFRAISPGLFGSWERFSERFAAPIEKHKNADRRQALARVLRPFVLRRTKSQVLAELPERTEVRLFAELSSAERELYEAARMKAVRDLAVDRVSPPSSPQRGKGRDQRFEVLAALTRLRQLACHPALVEASWKASSAKLDLLLETVDELREGRHRALIFSQFTRYLALVVRALDERGISYQYLDGATPAKKRQERIDAFQNGDGDLFLLSLKAGGTGLNLTAADYVIHMDPWWNPAVEDQATDRTHRIGQTRPVTVYRLIARGTLEEEILDLHADKRDLVSGVLEGTDRAAKLSTEELIGLIRFGTASDG